MNEKKMEKRRRVSLFWPIILIAVGVLLLLDNLEIMPGDFWDNLLRLWPLLLIAMGLDSLWKRQGLAGASLLIGLGVIFLLSNFGYLGVSSWQVIFNLWPLFLIAVGFDILIGNRSRIAAVLGMAFMVVILVGSLWLMGVGVGYTRAAGGQAIKQDLSGASQAEVRIEPGVGTLSITDMREPDTLAMGTVPSDDAIRITQTVEVEGDIAQYGLRAHGGNYAFPGAAEIFTWDLALNSEVPIDLGVELGVGDMNLDLAELDISALKLDLGVGQSTIFLPAQRRLNGTIDAAIGQVVIFVPPDVGLRVHKDTAMVVVSFPEDYHLAESIYTSPNFSASAQRIELKIDMGIGRIVIRER